MACLTNTCKIKTVFFSESLLSNYDVNSILHILWLARNSLYLFYLNSYLEVLTNILVGSPIVPEWDTYKYSAVSY